MSKLLHRWFIQYNPLFFASALCVLAGVFLLTRDPPEWTRGQLALGAVMQLYELGLIAGAAFLFNLPGQRRPAVILGITAIAFLFDVSFRTEAIASLGGSSLAPAIGWCALLAAKLTLISLALRVRIAPAHAALWTLAGVALAVTPELLHAAVLDRQSVLTAACWLGVALAACAALARPAVSSLVPLDDWGRAVLARVVAAAPVVWASLYWVHVVAWCGIYELRLAPACFAPAVLLVPFIARRERHVWVASALTLALAATRPDYVTAVAMLLAAGLALRAWQAAMPRLYLGAAGAAVVAAWPWFAPALPKKLAFWGAALVASGFAALAGGVGLNWWSSRTTRRELR